MQWGMNAGYLRVSLAIAMLIRVMQRPLFEDEIVAVVKFYSFYLYFFLIAHYYYNNNY